MGTLGNTGLSGGLSGGGASSLAVFAALTFSIAGGVITIEQNLNFDTFVRQSAGVYNGTFLVPGTDATKLFPFMTGLYAPDPSIAPVSLFLNRNTNILGGLGITTAGIAISTSDNAGFDVGRGIIAIWELP